MISTKFDSGNIKVVSESSDEASNTFALELVPEPFTEGTDKQAHSQWFHFRVDNLLEKPKHSFSISNAGGASYPEAWHGYKVAYSYDRVRWEREESTKYEDGVLSWDLEKPRGNSVWFAYFAPYSYERHQDLVAKCASSGVFEHQVLGQTLDGRSMDLLKAGTGDLVIWVIARQHPGETMAEWLMEGLLERILDASNDGVARDILNEATLYLVPNMNPDGSFRGHLRTNACGANLNREWTSTGEYEAPTLQRSPEVYHVLEKLKATGCHAFVDVHGDEEIPANFFAGTQGIPKWSTRLAKLFESFSKKMVVASPDFQIGMGYDNDEPNGANLAICGDHIAERFDCLAVTLEQPFKGIVKSSDMPLSTRDWLQWTPQRAMRLGGALLHALNMMVPEIAANKS